MIIHYYFRSFGETFQTDEKDTDTIKLKMLAPRTLYLNFILSRSLMQFNDHQFFNLKKYSNHF